MTTAETELELAVLEHRYRYYVLSNPMITDSEYDVLEQQARQLLPASSPVHSVGSSLSSSYPIEVIQRVTGPQP